jgi:hypothetical protein
LRLIASFVHATVDWISLDDLNGSQSRTFSIVAHKQGV